jgi:nickel superoxide dismutase
VGDIKEGTMKKIFIVILFSIIAIGISGKCFAHCQIPCGIYDDEMRIRMISEDIKTVEKSMNAIKDLSKQKKKKYNQIVRWVNNKDQHADKINNEITYYFMAQRIITVKKSNTQEYKKYIYELELLHKLMIYSMKSKQTTDLLYVKKMRLVLKAFAKSYFSN